MYCNNINFRNVILYYVSYTSGDLACGLDRDLFNVFACQILQSKIGFNTEKQLKQTNSFYPKILQSKVRRAVLCACAHLCVWFVYWFCFFVGNPCLGRNQAWLNFIFINFIHLLAFGKRHVDDGEGIFNYLTTFIFWIWFSFSVLKPVILMMIDIN